MSANDRPRIFDTDRRIRLGIWGLGRGMSFYNCCRYLNIDVVAGCDYNEHMRKGFLASNPGAYVTADAKEFLKQDFDAVLLATFCPAHGADAIQCLQAGKHVLSEVTAFNTVAAGVRLVDEVEKRGLVYNLAENYPFSAANMWLANRWREGLFGDMMYAEYEYVHECRSLAYTYIDGLPVQPGHTVHNWRSWFNFHYYCTHSLGPVMVITGTRPVKVETFAATPRIAGYLRGQGADNGTMTPSLIQMSNGGVVRNLMGAATNDTHNQRIWGTLGAFTIGHDGVKLRLGASGQSPMLNVNPRWEGLGEIAAQTGHGGGDFWVLYYFAREILTGEKGPFDVYGAADVTLPGILAFRSSLEGGRPFEVPDFRKRADRDAWRRDEWTQKRYNVARGVFGGAALNADARRFSTVMRDVVRYTPLYRAYADWKKVSGSLVRPEEFQPIVQRLLDSFADLRTAYQAAGRIMKAYPKSDGARVLGEMLAVGEARKVLAPGFLKALKREAAALRRRYKPGASLEFRTAQVSPLLPKPKDIRLARLPRKALRFRAASYNPEGRFLDIRPAHGRQDGLVYLRVALRLPKAGPGRVLYNADGPFKLWVNGRVAGCHPDATNPATHDGRQAAVVWRKGLNTIVYAIDTNNGRAWCGVGRAVVE